jgi:hypothetical protein
LISPFTSSIKTNKGERKNLPLRRYGAFCCYYKQCSNRTVAKKNNTKLKPEVLATTSMARGVVMTKGFPSDVDFDMY